MKFQFVFFGLSCLWLWCQIWKPMNRSFRSQRIILMFSSNDFIVLSVIETTLNSFSFLWWLNMVVTVLTHCKSFKSIRFCVFTIRPNVLTLSLQTEQVEAHKFRLSSSQDQKRQKSYFRFLIHPTQNKKFFQVSLCAQTSTSTLGILCFSKYSPCKQIKLSLRSCVSFQDVVTLALKTQILREAPQPRDCHPHSPGNPMPPSYNDAEPQSFLQMELLDA